MARSASPMSGISMLLLAVAALAAMPNSAEAQFQLPPLPYNYSGLEPVTDNITLYFHHNILNLDHVNKLNDALAEYNSTYNNSFLYNLTLTQMIRLVGPNSTLPVPANVLVTLTNNVGGAWQHAFFWKIMAPVGTPETALPSNSSNLTQAVLNAFGSWEALFTEVETVGANVFGSGWAWVVCLQNGSLATTSTPNQNSPLNGPDFSIPILGIDVWEHSYYLGYGPARSAFLSNWWSIANWQQIEANYETAMQGLSGDPTVLAALIGPDANLQVPATPA